MSNASGSSSSARALLRKARTDSKRKRKQALPDKLAKDLQISEAVVEEKATPKRTKVEEKKPEPSSMVIEGVPSGFFDTGIQPSIEIEKDEEDDQQQQLEEDFTAFEDAIANLNDKQEEEEEIKDEWDEQKFQDNLKEDEDHQDKIWQLRATKLQELRQSIKQSQDSQANGNSVATDPEDSDDDSISSNDELLTDWRSSKI